MILFTSASRLTAFMTRSCSSCSRLSRRSSRRVFLSLRTKARRKQKARRPKSPGRLTSSIDCCESSGSFDDFDNRLRLDHHLRLVEQMEALHQQLVAAALDVQDAEASADIVLCRHLSAHQLALLCISGDFKAIGVEQRLRELFFLSADHVADAV